MKRTPIALIVAIDGKNGISRSGSIPWKIKEDIHFFQDVTKREYVKGLKNAVIMGRKTWEQCGSLKDRVNIVITSKNIISQNDVKSVSTFKEAVDLCQVEMDLGKIFICGGSIIYNEAIRTMNIDELYVTRIFKNYFCDNVLSFDFAAYHSPIFHGYKLYKNHNFSVTDHNTGKKVDIEFAKYSKNILKSNKEEEQYLNLLEHILKEGHFRKTRNSNTWSVFGKNLEFDLSNGLPIFTTKKVFFRGVFEELLFFLKGDTNSKHLSEKGIKIWEQNTSRKFLDSMGHFEYEEGTMGPMYGYQLKHFNARYNGPDANYEGQGFDQIEYCLDLLKNDPFSRRIIMTTYNPGQAKEGVLYPCHGITIQFYVEKGYRLSCVMHQRSADIFLGNPWNCIAYSLLIHFFCEIINNDPKYTGNKLSPGRLIMNLGDVHIYEDHYSECIRQILRDPYDFPQLVFKRKVTEITDFKFEDLELINYTSYPNIPAKMIA